MFQDIILKEVEGDRFFIKDNKLWDKQWGSQPVMEDSDFERETNQWIVENARGDVLIYGLGVGLIVYPIMKKDNVNSILIVERHQEVIDLVMPQTEFNDKVKVIQGDAFLHEPDKQYDTIWLTSGTRLRMIMSAERQESYTEIPANNGSAECRLI